MIVLPLSHGETFYGILAIYADQSNAFDETERDTLQELGETIAAGIHAVEIRQRLAEHEHEHEQN